MSRRLMIYVPEIDPRTFVFFFYKGETGRSYSVRDYSVSGCRGERYAAEFPYRAEEIVATAQRPGCYCFPAEAHPTTDNGHWHRRTIELNCRYLAEEPQRALPDPVREHQASAQRPAIPDGSFPILDRDRLLAMSKARKRSDLERMLRSGASEDYVTWNVFALLRRLPDEVWWPAFVAAAARRNPGLSAAVYAYDPPEVELWRCMPSPPRYEAASRRRMLRSGDPDWVARGAKPEPVEGKSEIDVVLAGRAYLIFIEAKLGSDVSLQTTYDPARNQIARNIDCLIERTGERQPFFWLLARDEAPGREYVRLLDGYRTDPLELAAALPHRSVAAVEAVARNLTLLCWQDLLPVLRGEAWDEEAAEVLAEIERRVGTAVPGEARQRGPSVGDLRAEPTPSGVRSNGPTPRPEAEAEATRRPGNGRGEAALELFDPVWHSLLRRLEDAGEWAIDGGEDVLDAGRVVGTTVAELRCGERRLALLDGDDSGAAALAGVLERQGRRACVVPRDPLGALVREVLERAAA